MKKENKLVNTIREKAKQHKIGVFVLVLVLIVAIIAGISVLASQEKVEIVYKETTVAYGELAVGIETSGSVEIGTEDQIFELDLSQYVSNTSVSSSSSSNGGNFGGGVPGGAMMGGGNQGGNSGGRDMFSQMMGLAGGGVSGTTAKDTGILEIDEVCVTSGQEIKVGDILYRIDEESISEIRAQLESDVETAKADLDLILAENELSALSAKNTYDLAIAYGSYADVEYADTIQTAEKAVSDLEEQIALYEEELAADKESLELLQKEFDMVSETAAAFKWSVDHMDSEDETKLYLEYENSRESAQSNADSIESSIEQTEETIEKNEEMLIDLNTQLAQAKRSLAEAKLSAKKTYDLRMLSNTTAQETYDVTTSYLSINSREQEDAYQDAKEKLEEFDKNVRDGAIVSEYEGVITEVPLTTDDSITTNTTLLTVYDKEDTTITVSIEDEDIERIVEGGKVNISFTAYPEQLFAGEVTEIGDAETDNDGETTYSVTVTILGDVSGLYESMTGDLTFITKETQNVVYVSNRAITRKGNKSYVKMKNESGKIIEKEVTTGFSDGENVEIIEGLAEGEVVLIESKVSD